MVKFYIFVIITILISSLVAEENSVEYFGKVEIEDLFIKNETNKNLTKKEIISDTQLDRILINNEDLVLESLEIADIDIATFGEYEKFLNKFYEDNYYTITSKTLKQLQFGVTGSTGTRIPFGGNAKSAFNSGLNLGFSISPKYTFKILKYDSNIFGNLIYLKDLSKKINFTKHIKLDD